MRLIGVVILASALALGGCGSSSSDSGTEISCSQYKIYDGNVYRFLKGEIELFRPATPDDYLKYCEVSESPI